MLPSFRLAANLNETTEDATGLLHQSSSPQVTGALIVSSESSSYGDAFTIAAKIMPTAGAAVPQGAVKFYIDGLPVEDTNLGAGCAGLLQPTGVPATSAVAFCSIPAGNTYAIGSHSISATYSGDSVYPSAKLIGSHPHAIGNTNSLLYLCIGPTAACPSTGAISPPPPYIANLTMTYGQTWNGVMEAVSLDGIALTGDLSLNDVYNGVPSTLCTLPVSSAGSCPVAVGTTMGTDAGTHVFTVVYSGDSGHTGSTSPSVTIMVLQDATTGSLVSSPNPATVGQPVTFTATLIGDYAPPTGTVAFVEYFPPTSLVTQLGTGTLVPGSGLTSTATFTTSTLTVGSHQIGATYAATTDFAAASTNIITQVITPLNSGNFTLTVTPNPVNLGVGLGTLLTVKVTAQQGFTGDVNLACSDLPTEATCNFSTTKITGGSGTASLFLNTTAPHTCGTTQPYFVGGNGVGPRIAPIALPALAGLLAIFIPGKRRWLRALFAVVLAAGAAQITGCSTCTDLGTRPATYTFHVTASAAGTSEVETQAITLSVTI